MRYNVGDRVIYTGLREDNQGNIGTITSRPSEDNYIIEFDNRTGNTYAGTKENYGWRTSSAMFKPYKEETLDILITKLINKQISPEAYKAGVGQRGI